MEDVYPALVLNQLRLTNQVTGVELFSDLHFKLSAGEMVGIQGASGVGKSLLCRSLVGLLPQTFRMVGEMELRITSDHGYSLSSLSEASWPEIRKKYISIIFQDPLKYLNPVLTVGHQIKEMAPGASLDSIYELLIQLEFPDPQPIYNKYPHQLSGGQLQRIHLAIALIKKTPFLIADEITTGLDVFTEEHIFRLLRKITDNRELGVLFVTHNQSLVKEFADRKVEIKHLQYASGFPPKISRSNGNKRGQEIISVNHVTIIYDTVNALGFRKTSIQAAQAISFRVNAGEILALVGETASGKSSIGRAIAGLVDLQGGHIQVGGQSINKLSRRELSKLVQIVFQDSLAALTPHLTIRSLLKEADEDLAEPDIQALMSQVGLDEEILDRYPHQLSGGQRQRVLFGRALVKKPKLLICDESIASLDEDSQSRIIQLLMELRLVMNLAIIFITHQIGWAVKIADKMLVLREGKVMDYGPVDELIHNPHSAYTRNLLSQI